MSYSSTPFVVLAMRCTFCLLRLWRVDLTYVRSVVQSLTPPCLRQIGSAVSGRPRRRPSFMHLMRWAVSRWSSALPREAETASLDSISSIRSIRIVPSPGSEGIGLGEPEASSPGASSGSSSSVDARVLRDLEVMKAGHDLDTTVTEGSLATIMEQYNIPAEYRLHV
ncbi:hypothetical protein GW17_00010915 [Ensete ventricosum]|nr:hypothetical protein GW17_00010915 [Ensete ventricosum]